MPALRGLFVPNMTPLDARGEINEAELRRYVDWLIAKGVHGLYPNGSTGEFTRFTVEERRRIVKICCEQARGKAIVLAGAAEANVRETLKACEAYRDYGARAVAIVAPFYYKLSSESVYAYFREIAINSPIDVTLYNIPWLASPIDLPTLVRLSEFPRIVGVKDSSGDMAFMMRMIRSIRPRRPEFSFLCGWEAALAPMLLMGADGGTNALTGVVPELMLKLWNLCQPGANQGPSGGGATCDINDVAQARDLQFRLLELFDAILYSADFPEGVRVAVEQRGFDFGASRQPLSDAQRIDRGGLSKLIQCILADFGFAEAPAEGCARRVADPQRDRIEQITQAVLRRLTGQASS